MRILVVEDDRKVASFIQKGLEEEGMSVDVLNDGDDAATQAAMVDYDCIVLDLMLPGRSGFQVLRDMRARKPEQPVLILSAQGSPEDRVVGLNGGADDYMAKPFILAELSARHPGVVAAWQAARDATACRRPRDRHHPAPRVARAGVAIELKPKEYALLEFLDAATATAR